MVAHEFRTRAALGLALAGSALFACGSTIIEDSADASGGSAGAHAGASSSSDVGGTVAANGGSVPVSVAGASIGGLSAAGAPPEDAAGEPGAFVAGAGQGGSTTASGGVAGNSSGGSGGSGGSGSGGSGAVCTHATGWVNRTPSLLPQSWPSARQGPAFAFDTLLGKTVLYGGYSLVSFLDVQDTWAWDGTAGSWNQFQVAGPSGSGRCASAYDSTRQRLMLFGCEGATRSLWEWSGADSAWTDRTPTTFPTLWPPDSSWVAAYDASRQRFVIQETYEPGNALHQTWELDPDAGTWANRSGSPAPGGIFAAFTWDSARGRGVLFGGDSLAELWEWNSMTGRWLSRLRPPGAPWPTARSGAVTAFDSTRGRPLLFGGTAPSPPFNPMNGPPPPPTLLNDLWEWDGELGSWIELDDGTCSTAPPGRNSQTMTFDPVRSRAVLYQGGDTAGGPYSQVWEWQRPVEK
jgi:hypothetical protein